MSVYTAKQLDFMKMWQRNELKRINILEGSVSSGKTWISLVAWAFWVNTMPKDPDCLYLMSARSLTTLKRNCLLLLQSLVGESNFRFSISTKEGWLFGRHILLEGADDARAESKIRGLTLQGAYCDEVTKLPHDFWTMLLSRLRKPGAKLFATTNPDAPGHWLKVEYLDRADELDILIIKFLLDDNTTLPQDYVDNIKKEYTGVFYDRFIRGAWVLAEGLIYPMYQQAIEDPPKDQNGNPIKPSDYRLSIDYGTMNAFAALMWEKYGKTWYATRGYYYSGRDKGVTKTDEEYGKDLDVFVKPTIDSMPPQYVMYEQTKRKLKVIIDPSAASFITLLRKKDWCTVIHADNDVVDGIRDTATAMLTGLIKISPSIKDWKTEAEGYVWDDTSGEDRPVKVADHYMDATRYMVYTERLVVKSKRKSA